MLISNDFKVESDYMNVVLYARKTNQNTMEEYWDIAGYFTAIKSVLNHMINKEICGPGLKDYEKICTRIDELHDIIMEIPVDVEDSVVDMLIGDNYKADGDYMNVSLYTKKINQNTMEEYWDVIGYFTTIKSILKHIVTREVCGTGLKDFKEACATLDGLHDIIAGVSTVAKTA